MNKNIFNHDKFNTWQNCPKKFYLKYIKQIRLPEFNMDYRLGKSVHALLDYKLRGFKIDNLLKDADEDILNCWNIIKNDSILSKKLLKTEWGFNSCIKNTPYWLIGRIDAIFFDKEKNKYIIADWKTGKFIPKKIHSNFQHKVYLYAFYQAQKDLSLSFKPEDLCFQYFKILEGSVEITEIEFSSEKLLEYENSFLKIIKEIENTKDISIFKQCNQKNCEYKNLCS